MCILDDAIKSILNHFNNNSNSCAQQQYEYGWLFWRDCNTQQLLPGIRVDSLNTNSVNLYPDKVRLEILKQHYQIKQKLLIGEFHVHPKGKGTWVGQFPSPADIVNTNISVAGSKWPLNPPFKGFDYVDVSLEFQIIQSLIFGDLIVLERGPAWKPFNSINEQQKELDSIRLKYSQWHRNAYKRLSRIGSLDHKSFYKILSEEVKDIGTTLDSRFKITSIQND